MKKIIALFIFAGLLTTLTTFAGQPDQRQAQKTLPAPFMNRWYVGGQFGLAIPGGTGSANANTGFNLDGHAGYRFNRYFRLGGAFAYYRNSITGGTAFNLTTLMTNGYIEYPLDYGVVPFMGFGIGWGHISSGTGAFVPNSSNEFVYQGILGLGYYLNQNLAVQMSYHSRYIPMQRYDVL